MERQQDREYSPIWRNLTKLFPAVFVVAAVGMTGFRANAESTEQITKIQEENEGWMAAEELEEMLAVLYAPEAKNKDAQTEALKDNKAADKKSSAIKTAAAPSQSTPSASATSAVSGQGSTATPTTTVPASGYRDGIYQGSAMGFGGTITVQVTISGGKITAIDILGAAGETPSYLESAKAVIDKIIAGQTPNVDAVSGATYSSNGIIQAVQNALAQAAQGTEFNNDMPIEIPIPTAIPAPTTTPKPTDQLDESEEVNEEETDEKEEIIYIDGTYTGSGVGFNGTTTVVITVENGTIVSAVYETEDDEEEFYMAWSSIYQQILGNQSADGIDTVSGATFSSEGLIEAFQDALKQAKGETQ